MNRNDLVEEISEKDWIVEVKMGLGSGSSITMGKHGVIVITFNDDGTITFPSNIDFWPSEYHRWEFDEENQKIKFLNPEGDVSSIFGLPEKMGSRLVMNDHDHRAQKRRLVTYLKLNREIRNQIMPSVKLNAGNIIMTNVNNSRSPLLKMVKKEQIAVHTLNKDLFSIDGMEEVFDYLIKHDQVQKVSLIENDQIDSSPFDQDVGYKIRLYNQPLILTATRSSMIEVIGKVLIEYKQEAFRQKMKISQFNISVFFKILKKHFAKRIIICDEI